MNLELTTDVADVENGEFLSEVCARVQEVRDTCSSTYDAWFKGSKKEQIDAAVWKLNETLDRMPKSLDENTALEIIAQIAAAARSVVWIGTRFPRMSGMAPFVEAFKHQRILLARLGHDIDASDEQTGDGYMEPDDRPVQIEGV